jgi:hypothetical protein
MAQPDADRADADRADADRGDAVGRSVVARHAARLRAARLVAVAVLAFLLFDYPFLAMADKPVRVLGLPLLWVYLFAAWLAVIVLVARTGRDADP